MRDTYEFTDQGQYEEITCPKRGLKIQLIHTDHIPDELPEDALIAFGILNPGKKGLAEFEVKQKMINAFCILDPDAIDFEPYFIHPVLISNAIHDWYGRELKCAPDEIVYSPGYQQRFIDTMSLEPGKMSPELQAYMSRDPSEEPLDFFEWKEKHLKPFLN